MSAEQNQNTVTQILTNAATDPWAYVGAIGAAADALSVSANESLSAAAANLQKIADALRSGGSSALSQAEAKLAISETYKNLASGLSSQLSGLKAQLENRAGDIAARAEQSIANAISDLGKAEQAAAASLSAEIGASEAEAIGKGAGAIINAIQLTQALSNDNLNDVGKTAFSIGVGIFVGLVGGAFGLVGAPIVIAAVVAGIAADLVWNNWLGDLLAPDKQAPFWNQFFHFWLEDVPEAVSNFFNGSQKSRRYRDPLTLDLNGNGLETVAPSSTNPILFDHDGDGIKSGTGWVAPNDGFLVWDKSGNGLIDSGRELFGDAFIKADGTNAVDGFDALASLDSNGNGLVDAADINFNNLRVWQDANQDGISQSGELKTLASLGIASFNVAKTAHSQTLPDGNQVADLGTFNRTDGSEGTLGDVSRLADINLVSDTFYREFPDTIPLAAGVEALPDMQGSGAVRDLREAASQSGALQTLLTQYNVAPTRAAQMALLDQMLAAWAETSGMKDSLEERAADIPPTVGVSGYKFRYMGFGTVARSAHVGEAASDGSGIPNPDPNFVSATLPDDAHNVWLDSSYKALIAGWAGKIHILEAFNGRYFFELPSEAPSTGIILSAVEGLNQAPDLPLYDAGGFKTMLISYSQQQLDLLQQSYDALRQSIYDNLLLQTRLKPLIDKVGLTVGDDGISFDFSAVETDLRARVATDPVAGIADIADFKAVTRDLFVGTGWSGDALLQWAFDTYPVTDAEVPRYAAESRFRVVGYNGFTGTGTADADLLMAGVGGSVINAGAGNDTVEGAAGNDTLYGGYGTDTLDGGDGNDTLIDQDNPSESTTFYGGAGNDYIVGSGTFVGGTGNDTLVGPTGANDTYLFNVGDGQDLISEFLGNDTLKFGPGIVPGSVALSRVGNDLVFQLNASDQVRVQDWYSGDYRMYIENVQFDDGTIWDVSKVNALAANHAPVLVNALPDLISNEDTLFTSAVPTSTFIDADAGDILTYSAKLSSGAALPSWLTFNAVTRTFSGTPVNANVGFIDVQITATDKAGTTANDVMRITVVNTNDAPVAVADTKAATEDVSVTTTAATGVLANDTDVDSGDTRTVSAVSFGATAGTLGSALNGTYGTLTLAADGAYTYLANKAAAEALAAGQTATEAFTYTVKDAAGATSSSTLTFTITGTNDAPVIGAAIAAQSGKEGLAFTFTVPAGSFTDIDTGDTLTYSAKLTSGSTLPTWLTFNAATRTLSGTPPVGTAGTLAVQITATDTAGSSATSNFNLAIATAINTLNGTSAAEKLTGTAADDKINGLAGNDTLIGAAGNDTLDGGTGNDSLSGGTGNDTYLVDSTSDIVTENAAEGTDLIQASVTWTLGTNVENLTLTGTSAINGTGNTLANVLTGNSAANTLDGGTGADTLIGGAGNDTYLVDNTGDVVTENAAEGTDLVKASITYTLGTNLENLTLTGTTALNGTGNTLDNVLTGNSAINTLTGGAGNDTLDGAGGADSLIGGTGNDTYLIDNTGDKITENPGEGTDTV
ncbi:MAG: Hemolysin-type calcium-binding region, partial [Rhodocyclales bacterium]|nr:Hemolysin-type calcium-binding region [Rhodocyclales bacterium]